MLPSLAAFQDFSEIIYVKAGDLFFLASLVLFKGHLSIQRNFTVGCVLFFVAVCRLSLIEVNGGYSLGVVCGLLLGVA